ncbi:unnamed protein product, partial [Musa textilis]
CTCATFPSSASSTSPATLFEAPFPAASGPPPPSSKSTSPITPSLAPSGWTPRDPRRRFSGRLILRKPVHQSDRPCPASAPGDPRSVASLHFASKASVAHSSSPAPSVVVRRQRHELICS